MLSDYLYSVEDVWVIWLVSISVLSVLIYSSLSCRNWANLREFAKDEEGASYALPYLMTFPFYMLTVCFVVQGTMILIVKVGVMYSAHTAVRSAVVWRPSDPSDEKKGLRTAEKKAQHAAVLAITPFASGYDGHQQLYQYSPGGLVKAFKAQYPATLYVKLYKNLAQHSEAKDALADEAYLRRKYVLASAMTTVTLTKHKNEFNSLISANVKYRMPIHIPGAGRVMGTLHWTGKGYYRDIRATATLPLETPESANRTLGIKYDASRL